MPVPQPSTEEQIARHKARSPEEQAERKVARKTRRAAKKKKAGNDSHINSLAFIMMKQQFYAKLRESA
jgi:hypothetical protein